MERVDSIIKRMFSRPYQLTITADTTPFTDKDGNQDRRYHIVTQSYDCTKAHVVDCRKDMIDLVTKLLEE